MPTFTDYVTKITATWLNRIDTAIQGAGTWVIDKASGSGIKVDTTTPTYPWQDMIGIIMPDQQGANAPTLGAFIGGSVRRYFFSATDKADCEFHIPHDYVPGTDLYIHHHWSHNGTNISGTNTVTYAFTYAKGHNQGDSSEFTAEKTFDVSDTNISINTHRRYGHFISEAQLSTTGGSATQLNTTDLEVDGVIGVNITQKTIPTITGGSVAEPAIFFVDIHYQSTGIGTKQKSPPFWT